MITCWTATDFALQWLWVVLILIGAGAFIWRRIHSTLNSKRRDTPSGCEGCALVSKCQQEGPSVNCTNGAGARRDADMSGSQCGNI